MVATQDSDQVESNLVVLVMDLGYLVSFAKSNSSQQTAHLPRPRSGKRRFGVLLTPAVPRRGAAHLAEWGTHSPGSPWRIRMRRQG